MVKKEVIYNYEINPMTMAILSSENTDGSWSTTVLEKNSEYIAFQVPTKMIEHACRFYGASLSGRLEGTRNIANITHKPPIVIDPGLGMYFFPTASPRKRSCSWFAHSYVDEIQPIENGVGTAVHFITGKTTIIDISFTSMKNQLNRTAQFRFRLDGRMK